MQQKYAGIEKGEPMKEEKNETGAWLKVEDLYGDGNPKEGQLCLGKKGDGTIWLYRFSWWDDVTGAFYPMINPTESDREWDEDVTEIMMLDRILPFEE